MSAGLAQKKYYVTSGNLRWVGSADTPKEAAKKAVHNLGGKDKLDGYFIWVDERGHRTTEAGTDEYHNIPNRAMFKFDTDIILRQAGFKDDDE